MQKYSVLMAVYIKDNPEYFAIALDSMINQTYPPDEIVIVKCGQITEELQIIIHDRQKRNASITEVPLAADPGFALSLNAGLEACRNELVARMDADDCSYPERCELQVKEFEKNPSLDIVGTQIREFIGTMDNVTGERKVPLSNEEIYEFAKLRDPFNHPTVMYKKSAVQAVGSYSDCSNEDTDLWIKMLSRNAVCMNIDIPLLYFRFDEQTYRRRKSWKQTKALLGIRYSAWQKGFNTTREFLTIAGGQLLLYIFPPSFTKFIYKNMLRTAVDS